MNEIAEPVPNASSSRLASATVCSATFRPQFEELARTIALEAGKPIKQARGEVGRSVTTFATAAIRR